MKKQKAQMLPSLLLAAGCFWLIFAAWLFLRQNEAGQATLPPASSGHNEETYPEITRVSIEQAKAALDSGTAVFVDVRGAEAYDISHIPSSLSIPLGELEERISELDPNQWIITYCT